MSKPILFPCDGAISVGRFVHTRPGAMRDDEIRFSAVFVNALGGDIYAVLGWSCESVLTGRTEQANDIDSPSLRFRSVNDLAFEIKRVVDGSGASNKIEIDEVLEGIRDGIRKDPRPSFQWVWEFAGIGDEEATNQASAIPAPDGAKTIGEQVVAAAKAHKATRGTKKEKMEAAAVAVDSITAPIVAETAGEPPALPVSPIAPLIAEVAKVSAPMAEFLTTISTPTHFRGVSLRPASDWADPSAEGVFVGVSNADYHADKGSLSSTRIKALVQSEAHALVPVEISQAARDIGTLVHGFALEGFTTAEQMGFKVVEGKTTTKEGCVTTTMIATAQGCTKALLDDAGARPLISRDGLSELSVRVRCPDTGLMLRARFDRAPAEGYGLFDIKTTGDSIERFATSFYDFGYDVQAYHYLRAAELAGLGYRGMTFVVVCKDAPHEVGLFHFANSTQVADDWDLAAKSHRTACAREQHIRTTGEARKRTHEPMWPNAKSYQAENRKRRLGDTDVPY